MRAAACRILGVEEDADWIVVRARFRDLARRFHPDGTTPDVERMAEINRAYEVLERSRRRTADGARPPVAVGPGRPTRWEGGGTLSHPPETAAPKGGSLLERVERVERGQYGATPVIDFGEYAGWRVADVARVDPQYLRWLSRHSAGVRYRAAVAEALGEDATVGRRATILR